MLPTSDRGHGRRLHRVGGVVGLGGAAGLSSVSSHEPVTLTLEAPLRTLVNPRPARYRRGGSLCDGRRHSCRARGEYAFRVRPVRMRYVDTARNGRVTESPSMSRRGNCRDNAVAESFFSSLKKERIKKRIYKTRDLAKADVFDYIEAFYNRTRRHSHLGGISPEAFEHASK
jgi:Integrase core domain